MKATGNKKRTRRTGKETTPKTDNENLGKLAIDGQIPKAVAYPTTNEEAAEFLREADSTGKKVSVRGGGTKLRIGNSIEGLDLVISTRKLNQILEYEAADLTLCVQAGANLAQVQSKLEKQGQFLPITSPLSATATVGGAIASNSSGPTRLQYGAARDWLIGVRFALADGTLAKGGGRVVKNVAGFDMMKLMIGSMGTLAMLLELNLKLLPLPKARATVLIPFNAEHEACEAALRIIDKGIFPTAETVLDSNGAESLGLEARTTLLIEVRNTAQAVERQLREIQQLVWQLSGAKVERINDEDSQSKFWSPVTDFAYRPSLNAPNTLVIKAGVVPTQVAMIIRQAHQSAKMNNIQVECMAHAGHGILYVVAKYPENDEETALKFIKEITAKVESNSGSAIIEQAPLTLKTQLKDIWGNALSRTELRLMRDIKKKLDPNRTLNPGRFVNSI
ncbi:FAD-binding oxidoreductase [Candidatus Chlorohelix sp.]|uniref:FAD-binding oxidoreductase n=1 Tax=Candidatus Chlorohelix sp. TaxID=3139201 RepID=UPI003032BDE7